MGYISSNVPYIYDGRPTLLQMILDLNKRLEEVEKELAEIKGETQHTEGSGS